MEVLDAEEIRARVAPLRRPCWFPVVEPGDGDVRDSKYSGIPWLHPDEPWPKCPVCGALRQLFVQLDLVSLPARPRGCPEAGLVQLFYCTTDILECTASAPWHPSVLARLVHPEGPGKSLIGNPVPEAFPSTRIVGWEQWHEHPIDPEEIAEHGVEVTYEELEYFETADIGDKLLGWPGWIQDPLYPECIDCGERMEYFFQVESNGNLPFMFGDSGTGQLFMCSTHPHRIAFQWNGF